MCGLTGFWEAPARTADELDARVGRMADTLRHRGPDDRGTWVDAAAGVALGFRRLAILDLSPSGHQPMVSADGRFVLIFNGEIYNYRDLRTELAADGAQFRSTSDTEVILYGAMRWGWAALLPRLWGMFAMAMWDRQARRLQLARDRLGKKPLYYGVHGGALLFGSELKALRAHPAFSGRLDREALTLYTRFGYVPTPRSIYEGIHKLTAGASVVFESPTVPGPVQPYWRVQDAVEAGAVERGRVAAESEADEIDKLDTLLRDAVARRMIADVPLGAFLSGGIDSSTVVSLMQAQSARPVRTFTIGFHLNRYDEAAAAKAIAAHLGTDHTELYVTPQQALDVVPRLPEIYDEPFADSSQIPTFLVSRLARQHVTVAMSGDGGDEAFGGYTRYQWGDRVWRAIRHVPGTLRTLASVGVRRVSPRHWDRLYASIESLLPAHVRQSHPADKLYKAATLWDQRSADDVYLRLVSHWSNPATVVMEGVEPPDPLGVADARRVAPGFVERMMLLDFLTYLPDDILAKVDRASMATSLEARAPLLDHRVVEHAWRLPLSLKMRQGRGKWLLRRVLARYVPEALIERPKMGFGLPIGPWLRHDLRDWAEALLDERRLSDDGFFVPARVRALWNWHLQGHGTAEYPLWVILMFQAWLDAIRRDAAAA